MQRVCAFPSEPSYHTFAVIPNPESESLDHMYYCTVCGYHYYEPHTGTDPCYICGYSGPVG